jgi:hypothetical protein
MTPTPRVEPAMDAATGHGRHPDDSTAPIDRIDDDDHDDDARDKPAST